jgi:hypothetical protein
MTTLWSPRTLRKYLDTYQGTTPAESAAGYYFFPDNTGLNSSDVGLNLSGSATGDHSYGYSSNNIPFAANNSPIVVSSYQFATGDGTTQSFPLTDRYGDAQNPIVTSIIRTDWQGTKTLSTTPITNYILSSQNFITDNYYNTWSNLNQGVSDPAGTLTACTITSTSSQSSDYNLLQYTDIGGDGTYVSSYWLRRRTGSGTVGIADPANNSLHNVTLTTSWQQFYQSASLSNGDVAWWGIVIETSGDAVDVAFGQVQLGSTPTSYIPTPNLSNATTADYSISGSNINFGVTPSSGAQLFWSGTAGGNASGNTLSTNSKLTLAINGTAIGNGNGNSTISGTSSTPLVIGGGVSIQNETVTGVTVSSYVPKLRAAYSLGSTNNYSNISADFPGVVVQAGDLIITSVFILGVNAWYSGTTPVTLSDNSPSGSNIYTKGPGVSLPSTSGGASCWMQVYYTFASQAATLTITAVPSPGIYGEGSYGVNTACVGVYSGISQSNPFDTLNVSSQFVNSTTHKSGNIGTSGSNEMVLCFWDSLSAYAFTDTTGFTIEAQATTGGLGFTQKSFSSPIFNIFDTVTSTTDQFASVIVALNPLTATPSLSITGSVQGIQFVTINGTSTDALNITGLAAGLVNTTIATSSDSLTLTGSASGSVSTADNATSLATLTLTGSASGTFTALDSGTSSASLTLSGQIAASRGAQGSGTGPLTISGTIQAAQGNAGTSTDLLSLSGAATAAQGCASTSVDLLTLAGQITGSFIAPISGSGSDALSLSGQITAAQGCAGTSSDSLLISGSASGNAGSGTSVCTLSITGSASGTVKDFIGTSTGSLALTGSASGSSVVGSATDPLSLTGSASGSIVDFTGTLTGSLSLSGSATALVGESGSSSDSLSITGSASGTVKDFIGTASGSLVLTGTASGAQGEIGSSSDSLTLTGSASGSVIDFTGTSTGALSLSGSASASRGAAGASTVNITSLSGSATGSQGNQGSSAASLSITGSSAGAVEDFTAYSIEVLSFSGSAQASRGVAGAFLTAALLIAGFCSALTGESGQSQAQLQVSGSAQAKVITVASSSDQMPPVSGQAAGVVIFTVHGGSVETLTLSGSATAQTSNPVSINPAYLVNPPARNWVCTAQQKSYLVSPPARVWTVSPAKRNYLVSPPARIWNV